MIVKIRIPNPDNYCEQLIEKIKIKISEILLYREVKVDTRKKLKDRQKIMYFSALCNSEQVIILEHPIQIPIINIL